MKVEFIGPLRHLDFVVHIDDVLPLHAGERRLISDDQFADLGKTELSVRHRTIVSVVFQVGEILRSLQIFVCARDAHTC